MKAFPFKKITVVILVLFIILSGFVLARPPEKSGFKNLKVLPKNIDEEQLDRIMHSFNAELGVTCIYCHVTDRSVNPPRADFISDAMPAKKKAREMLKMTFRLNKKYFNVDPRKNWKVPVAIWCVTCHHGLHKPVLPFKKTD